MTTWTAITTLPGRQAAESLGEAMEALNPAPTGVGVFEIEDGSGLWEVGGYFDGRPDVAGLALLEGLHDARPFAVSRVEERDWVAQVRRELHPIEAGRFTLFGGHDVHRIGVNRVGLRIEAAMAFGTGHHATTQGCLLLLELLLRRGLVPRRTADIGCGTGVLAIAALRTGCRFAVLSDIDQVAVATARENLRANRTPPAPCLRATGFRSPTIARTAPYDLVFANILAGPLKRLAPDMARHLALRGVAVLSGILSTQAAGVEAVYRGHGLAPIARIRLGGWTSLAMARRRWPL